MSLLTQVTSGKRRKPVALMIYAPKGLGKSSFASEADGVVFVGPEENDELEAPRLPQVKTWDQFKLQLKAIRDDKHDFKSLAIDSWDMLEGVAEKVILSGKDAKKNMATAMGGYGTAYKELAKMFREIRDEYLIPIREKRGMNIIIVNHAEKVKFEDPITVTSFDKYFTASHDRVKPIIEDWVSAVLFLTFELFRAETNGGKEYAEGEGERVIYTEERPSQTAKNRFNLPYEMPYELGSGWSNLMAHIDEFYGNAKQAVYVEPKKQAPKETSVKPNAEKEERTYFTKEEPAKTAKEMALFKKQWKGMSKDQQERWTKGEVASNIVDIEKKIEEHAESKDLEQEYKELLSKMPDNVKGSIETAFKRSKGEAKEVTRIINKMKGML